jgi:hypothetical protein
MQEATEWQGHGGPQVRGKLYSFSQWCYMYILTAIREVTYVPTRHLPNPLYWPGLSTKMNFFMQNKANFTKSQIYVSRVSTKNYAKRTLGGVGKTKPNKANSKPICRMLKMNVSRVSPKDYEEMSTWAIFENKANFRPKQTQFQPKTTTKSDPTTRIWCYKSTTMLKNINAAHNWFFTQSLHPAIKLYKSWCVDFLQQRLLTRIRVVSRKVVTKLKVYVDSWPHWLFSTVQANFSKSPILNRLGMNFAIFSNNYKQEVSLYLQSKRLKTEIAFYDEAG